MALYDMKELPHLVKPVALILVVLQTIFVFAPGYRSFGWFVVTTTIIELLICVTLVLALVLNVTALYNAPIWPTAEMTISAVFVVFQVINFFYFIVNMFKHFNLFLLFGMAETALLGIVWLFNAYQWFRTRTSASSASNANHAGAGAQPRFATPSYPAGANPA
ncbi:hypothetical protein KIN20_028946 [Parelaphostrongylus tenuis]|uniref:MARVEL domain-containing protein n=1 Tax=Parelaphostrongylus tenuis TaxID=148309 RepID=A0AAD5R1J1_PARTN|nr:hypothetical protein KIN20_028946 [Parelaphostrongylus tenuis]